MDNRPITPDRLAASVIAVPPLARCSDASLSHAENTKLIKHIESGGVSTLLYGGNANLYHARPSEYPELLDYLAREVSDKTLVIPAVGPAYGTMMDQATALAGTDFPSAMVLPQLSVTTFSGIATGIRKFVEASGKPAVLYLKDEGYLDIAHTRKLFDDGLISWIKYAIVRDNTSDDHFLRTLVEHVNPQWIVSGMGEQPAITHLRSFGLIGFTSGCVCINPSLSQKMLEALMSTDDVAAERIRNQFAPLEELRDTINPIRVLHEAVRLSGIAETGPILPLLENLEPVHFREVKSASEALSKL